MEESSEQRRRRLRALREEAQEQGQHREQLEEELTASLPSPGGTVLHPFSPVPDEPTNRFDFYTDPLAAFSSSQKKTKVKGSPSLYPRSRPSPTLHGSPSVSPSQQQRLPSPPPHMWGGHQEQHQRQHQLGSDQNFQHQQHESFWGKQHQEEQQRDYQQPTHRQHEHYQQEQQKQASFVPRQNPLPGVYSSSGNGNPGFIPPPPGCSSGLLSTPPPRGVSVHELRQGFQSPNPNTPTPQPPGVLGYEAGVGFGSPQPPGFQPRIGFGSPQLPGVLGYESRVGLGGQQPPGSLLVSPSTPVASAASFMPQSSGSYEASEGKSSGRGANHERGRGGSLGRRSWNSGGRGSPGGYRDSRTVEKFGNRGFQKSLEVSARDYPQLFYKKSMVIDPWKDLVPVRLDMVAVTAEDRLPKIGRGGEWLPKSIGKEIQEAPAVAQFSVSPMGPSLAESLAASFADAVGGEAD